MKISQNFFVEKVTDLFSIPFKKLKKMNESPSSNATIPEEVKKNHQETDIYLKNMKRTIILQILRQIKENPPPFLKDSRSGFKIGDLDRTIGGLNSILKKSQ